MEVKARGYSFGPDGFANLLAGDGLLFGLKKVDWSDVTCLKHVEGTNKITIQYYALQSLTSVTKSIKSSNFNVKAEDVEPIKEIARTYIPKVSVEERGRNYAEAAMPVIFLSGVAAIIILVLGFLYGYLIPSLVCALILVTVINFIAKITYDKNKKITLFKTGDKPSLIRSKF